MNVPDVLAGPILRRAERGRVAVWLATSIDAEVSGEVYQVTSNRMELLGIGSARTVRLGERLWVHLIVVRARRADGFPTGELLAYDVVMAGRGAPRRLAHMRPAESEPIIYGDLALPTFFLPDPGTPLHVFHGSCRLLHGAGTDAFVAADSTLGDWATDLERRPSALFLTGDQIYGDEVGGPLIGHLGELGRELIGAHDDAAVPGVESLADLPIYGRQTLVNERACFTSSKAGNHLLSLGEYAAAHVVAWDPATWPTQFAPVDRAVPGDDGDSRETRKNRRLYEREAERLELARAALPAVRRVLANVPVYMCFDDHDVTDDWNLTREWRQRVWASPTGRRIVANALGAFWAFQGWGNQPDEFDDTFIEAVTSGGSTRTGPPNAADEFERALWSFDRWSFAAPTEPPVVVLDTRTQRSYDSDQGAARLLSPGELKRVRSLMGDPGQDSERPAILVSAVPVFGLELQERRQKFLAGKLGPYEIDFEAWHSNLQGLMDLMSMLVDDLGLKRCVILSGDVHYGINVDASFAIGDREIEIAQVVSSSFKHSGSIARLLLNLLGRLVRPQHERLGWDAPPTVTQSTGLTRVTERLFNRSVNTDEWNDGGPVLINDKLAQRLAAGDEPVLHEHREYIGPEERRHWFLIGENNLGDLTVNGAGVVHRHLVTLNGHGMRTYTASLPWDGIEPELRAQG